MGAGTTTTLAQLPVPGPQWRSGGVADAHAHAAPVPVAVPAPAPVPPPSTAVVGPARPVPTRMPGVRAGAAMPGAATPGDTQHAARGSQRSEVSCIDPMPGLDDVRMLVAATGTGTACQFHLMPTHSTPEPPMRAPSPQPRPSRTLSRPSRRRVRPPTDARRTRPACHSPRLPPCRTERSRPTTVRRPSLGAQACWARGPSPISRPCRTRRRSDPTSRAACCEGAATVTPQQPAPRTWPRAGGTWRCAPGPFVRATLSHKRRIVVSGESDCFPLDEQLFVQCSRRGASRAGWPFARRRSHRALRRRRKCATYLRWMLAHVLPSESCLRAVHAPSPSVDPSHVTQMLALAAMSVGGRARLASASPAPSCAPVGP